MKKSSNVINALSKHYYTNLQLGIYYMDLSQQAMMMQMPNLSKFIKDLSDDKLTIHKDLIAKYLLDVSAEVQGQMPMVTLKKFDSCEDILKDILKIEDEIRNFVAETATLCLTEKDHETYNFWQWYVVDGIKDYNDIVAVNDYFSTSKDLLLIDTAIGNYMKEHAEK